MSGTSRARVNDVMVQQTYGGTWHTSIGWPIAWNIGGGIRTSENGGVSIRGIGARHIDVNGRMTGGGPGTTHIVTERCKATTTSGGTTIRSGACTTRAT